MQYLREKTEAVIPVADASAGLIVNGVPQGARDVVDVDGLPVVALTAEDTAVCGRLDVAGREFMVISTNAYDSLMGADTLQVDAVCVAGSKDGADALLSFGVSGYDRETGAVRKVADIGKVSVVEQVEQAVPVNFKPILNGLNKVAKAMNALLDPDRVVKARVERIDGVSTKSVIDGIMKMLEKIKTQDKVVRANVVEIEAKPVAKTLGAISTKLDRLVKKSDVLKVDVVELAGSEEAVLNARDAFNGKGYDFANCSIPLVKEFAELVPVNVVKFGGSKVVVGRIVSAFDGTGWDFRGCTFPTEDVTVETPVVDIGSIGGDKEIVSALVDLLAKGYDVKTHMMLEPEKPADAPDGNVVKADLVSIAGSKKLLDNFTRDYDGRGWDHPKSVINTRQRGER